MKSALGKSHRGWWTTIPLSGAKALPMLLMWLILVVCPTASHGQTAPSETLAKALVQACYECKEYDRQPAPLATIKWNSASDGIELEQRRSKEQGVLLRAVTYYMNLLRDTSEFYLYSHYYGSAAADPLHSRYRPVDLENPAAGRADLLPTEQHARIKLKESIIDYERIFGVHPRILGPANPISDGLPRTLADAERISQEEHPAIRAALESLLLVTRQGSVPPIGTSSSEGSPDFFPPTPRLGIMAFWKVSGPFYDSAIMYDSVAAADMLKRVWRLQLDAEREAAARAVDSTWTNYVASGADIEKTTSAIPRLESAVNRISEKGKSPKIDMELGEARSRLLSARIELVRAQRDRVVASYALMAAVGRLSLEALNISTQPYAVSWIGEIR